MTSCNHIWVIEPSCAPKQTVEELFESVKKAGIHGWWLRGSELDLVSEFDLVTELLDKGLVKLCEQCKNSDYDSQAVFIV